MEKIFRCKNCVTLSTRPRITFDERGFCSACQWSEEKKKINWKKRNDILNKLLKKHRSKNKTYDCITTVSGGKDGSYVSYKIKHKHNMKPLAITFRPSMETEIGIDNLNSFVNSGYDHLHITPNKEALRILNRIGLTEMGFPYYGWLIGIHTAVIRVALSYNIPLIFYSEDGEVEYGGDSKLKYNGIYNIDYQISNYLESGYDKVLFKAKKLGLKESQLYWFKFPPKKEYEKSNITITHYSFYENWDPYRNYMIAKEHCGLKEKESLNKGTYTNFAQNDSDLFPLHMYFMYLKFGFGRTTSDSAIDVRRGAMSRNQALELIKLYDNYCPEDLFDNYCDYYKMKKKDFLKNIDKWVNKKLFVKKRGRWEPYFKVI